MQIQVRKYDILNKIYAFGKVPADNLVSRYLLKPTEQAKNA